MDDLTRASYSSLDGEMFRGVRVWQVFRLSGRFAFDGEQEHAGELACRLKRSKQAGSVAKVLEARRSQDLTRLQICGSQVLALLCHEKFRVLTCLLALLQARGEFPRMFLLAIESATPRKTKNLPDTYSIIFATDRDAGEALLAGIVKGKVQFESPKLYSVVPLFNVNC